MDEHLLAALDDKLQLIRDRTQGVAEGYSNGFYLWGEGGTGKSFSVEKTLRKLGKPFKLSNTRVTGKGLFQLLRDHPDLIHIVEDAETLFKDQNSFGVLRSALWGQTNASGRQERVVVWHTAKTREEVIFTGGIILIGNVPLEDIPQLRALKTRIPVVHYQPTNDEIAALARKVAQEGHRCGPYYLPPEDCREVVEEIIGRCQRLQRNLDLRLFVGAFQDRLQWANGASETHWLDLLDSRMKERTVPAVLGRETRAERKHRELAIVRRIRNLPPQERLAAWMEETGKSQAALYRRLEELFSVSQFQGEVRSEKRVA